MRDLLIDLKQYCADLGADAEMLSDSDAKRRLPLFLRQLYDLYRAKIFGRELHLMICTAREHPTPGEVEAHAKLLTKQVGPEVAFVFDQLPSFERNRLLRRRIPFIVPHRQMFLPERMIDLREVHGKSGLEKVPSAFSMPAQLLLLYHLQKRRGEAPLALYEWAETLKCSRMSMTRTYRELLNSGLVEPAPSGKTVRIHFVGEGRGLWERALPQLRSPVQKEGHFRLRKKLSGILESGITALANYTDLAKGYQRTLAIWRLSQELLSGAEAMPYCDTDTVVLQRWWYPPTILAEDNRTVDRLSLFLSLHDNADERIQAALAQLLEGVKW